MRKGWLDKTVVKWTGVMTNLKNSCKPNGSKACKRMTNQTNFRGKKGENGVRSVKKTKINAKAV